jgi:hypothetical protein
MSIPITFHTWHIRSSLSKRVLNDSLHLDTYIKHIHLQPLPSGPSLLERPPLLSSFQKPHISLLQHL